ncbi:unnamed protein product [Prorocentrum cordatum]|uniref:MobA-like NTP transferase domain-containing protein n=1 Tax=Prorocentrum cordatum TaxID=2364126 RepID=A0ABN9PSY0_9DINO|nr:unnamed protein product [Polarella glacialis]
MEQLSKAAFCLVAGGLGERLGFPGIKISITAELATGACFLKMYVDFILAFQALSDHRFVCNCVFSHTRILFFVVDYFSPLQL